MSTEPVTVNVTLPPSTLDRLNRVIADVESLKRHRDDRADVEAVTSFVEWLGTRNNYIARHHRGQAMEEPAPIRVLAEQWLAERGTT